MVGIELITIEAQIVIASVETRRDLIMVIQDIINEVMDFFNTFLKKEAHTIGVEKREAGWLVLVESIEESEYMKRLALDDTVGLYEVEISDNKEIVSYRRTALRKRSEIYQNWWQHDPYLSSQAKVSPALKGTDEQKNFTDSSQQQAINITEDLPPKEDLELKTEATTSEKQVRASYERKNPESVIIDAIPVTGSSQSGSKINLNRSSWDYFSAEKLGSELRDGKTSSLGKPSVGKSIEKLPKK